MNSSDKTSVGKLHIVITIVILIEVIILLVVFIVFVLNKDSAEDASAVSEANNETVSYEEPSIEIIEETPTASDVTPTPTPLPTFEYTIDGITFDIPGKYKNINNSFQSDYSKIYFISQKIDGFWAIYMLASDEDIDGFADSAVSSYISGGMRESAKDSHVAGCKSRSYKYSGNVNKEKYILSAELIVSPDNDGVIGVIFLTPEDNSELEDYAFVIRSGR